MYDFTRSNWGARPASYVNKLSWDRVKHLIVHWPGTSGTIGSDVNRIKGYLRGWQDYHMNNKGWSDIAYSVGVDQEGRIWELRGWDRRDGATVGMGGISFSILAIMGTAETPSDKMKAGILKVIKMADSRNPNTKKSYHRAYVSGTACPGDKLAAWIRSGMRLDSASGLGTTTPKPTPKPSKPSATTAPAFPLKSGYYFGPRYPLSNAKSVSGYYSHRNDLHRWQQRMKDRGWRITADGLYGPQTEKVATAFQEEKGLAIDGLIGKNTWSAAWTMPVT